MRVCCAGRPGGWSQGVVRGDHRKRGIVQEIKGPTRLSSLNRVRGKREKIKPFPSSFNAPRPRKHAALAVRCQKTWMCGSSSQPAPPPPNERGILEPFNHGNWRWDSNNDAPVHGMQRLFSVPDRFVLAVLFSCTIFGVTGKVTNQGNCSTGCAGIAPFLEEVS